MWLRFEADGGDASVQWGDSSGPIGREFLVPLDTLRQAVDQFRPVLNNLALWSKTSIPQQLPPILLRLAQAGQDLKFALFDTRAVNDKASIQRWIATRYDAGDRTLSITADPDFHIPWSLICEGSPQDLAKSLTNAADFDKLLWAFRYDLKVGFSSFDPPDTEYTRSSEKIALLSVFDSDEYDYISTITSIAPLYDRLINIPVGAAFNLDTCNKLVSEARNFDTIFHFFGHGRDGNLVLKDGEVITPLKFKKLLEDLSQRLTNPNASSMGLIFLNACDSLLGSSDYSLRSAAARPGLCGIIAPEAEVPRDFAIRYGQALLSKLIDDGNSLGEAMTAIRRDPTWWPLSLLYASYATPEYRIRK